MLRVGSSDGHVCSARIWNQGLIEPRIRKRTYDFSPNQMIIGERTGGPAEIKTHGSSDALSDMLN